MFNFLKKKSQKSRTLLVYMFSADHQLLFFEAKTDTEDANRTFEYNGGRYVTDDEAVQYYRDGKPVYFFIEGIPNPLIFGLTKMISEFVEKKRDDPSTKVMSEGILVDVSLNSIALEKYKNDTFVNKIIEASPEHMKLVYMLIGVIGLSFMAIIFIVMFIK